MYFVTHPRRCWRIVSCGGCDFMPMKSHSSGKLAASRVAVPRLSSPAAKPETHDLCAVELERLEKQARESVGCGRLRSRKPSARVLSSPFVIGKRGRRVRGSGSGFFRPAIVACSGAAISGGRWRERGLGAWDLLDAVRWSSGEG